MLRKLYLGVVLFIGLYGLVTILPPFVHNVAASDYGISVTDDIYIGGNSLAGECEKTHMSASWSELMSDDPSDEWSYKNTWNYITNYDNTRQRLDEFHQRFVNNLATGSGWAVAIENTNKYGTGDGDSMAVRIILFDPPNSELTIPQGISGRMNVSNGSFYSSSFFLNPHADCAFVAYDRDKQSSYVYFDAIRPRSVFFVASDNITYPSDYTGELIPTTNTHADLDGDGLNAAKETEQGTSNSNKDTDGDGLDDYTESQWNPDRDDIFCGTQCAYPHPTTKDVYVEIDWMKDLSNNVYKPSTTQLSLVEDMFDAKGINFHADTGQFGGGNELSTYTQTLPYTVTPGQVDFWDYRNGGDGITTNFSTDRNLIWRYMIYGYNFAEFTSSTGWAEPMGDDLFISGGLIENISGLASLDRAVAGTIAHEVGHALCLSDERDYAEQPSECEFSGIDNDVYKPQNYASVMNYRYQLTDDDDMGVVDYSDGSNGTDDHDDWSAVALGMGGFSGTHTALGKIVGERYISPKGKVHSVSPDGSIIKHETSSIHDMVGSVEKEIQMTRGQDFNVVPTSISRPVEDDSGSNKLTSELTDEPSFDWTALLSSSAALAVIALGATWYYIVRK